MTNAPQFPQGVDGHVDRPHRSSTPCGSANHGLTWGFGSFSTIHTPYYSYWVLQ
jgi:hypothetical protein